MPSNNVIMLMGTEKSGLYPFTIMLKRALLNVGNPQWFLKKPGITKLHDPVGYDFYMLIRRFFEDIGLPPIAEPPFSRIGMAHEEYFISALARTFRDKIQKSSYICSDHLTALLFPYIKCACEYYEIPVYYYFFYSSPQNEIAVLQKEGAVPGALSEFIWRNIVTAIARHGLKNIKFVNTDEIDSAGYKSLMEEICAIYGTDVRVEQVFNFHKSSFLYDYAISPETEHIYNALKSDDMEMIYSLARENYQSFKAQSGWQYTDCLERSELDSQRRRLADRSLSDRQELPPEVSFPENDSEWKQMLDECERKLLETRQEYEAKQFLYSQATQRHYEHLIRETQADCKAQLEKYREKRSALRLRHKQRLRVLFDKSRNQL